MSDGEIIAGEYKRESLLAEAIVGLPVFSRVTYNDTLVRQLIDTIKVMGEDKLEITFKCGLKYEQSITPKVKKLNIAL